MPTDYAKLRSDNIRRYGEDIGRIGPMLLAQRYDNRSHFIFELLQNAEDALRRQVPPAQNREVQFRLDDDALVFSHFGAPFTPEDVRFICGIGESTETHAQRLTDIGRFGIGFKSVYAFTDRPEIHSGDEHFAIEDYVRPCGIAPIPTEPGQTVFRFPFRVDDETAHQDIHEGLSDLDLSTLIFLREIEQVSWHSGESRGNYLRETRILPTANSARKITIVSESGADATYLVFERPVFKPEHREKSVGRVEVAYHLLKDRVEPVESAKLSVFFPTIVPTQFGAILQGPFRTTPSRDNIPRDDVWNKHLVAELAALVPDSIRHLKLIDKLDAKALEALPIHRARFDAEALFSPVFDSVKAAFFTEPLVPCQDGVHRPAAEVRLGRTAEIRALFSPQQLGDLHSSPVPLAWVTEGVTRDRTPQLRDYFNSELKIPEIEASAILSRLHSVFLEAQSSAWIARLYEFLAEQEGAWRSTNLLSKPIIRLSDGSHVQPFEDDKPLAYLPASNTDYPSVHPDVCAHAPALGFLKRIGITAPDVVDDVIEHLLPRFRDLAYEPSESDYAAAIARIHNAEATENSTKRSRLLEALRETPFVFATDAATGQRRRICPSEGYIDTERLSALFAGIGDVWFVDKRAGQIENETHRKLLRACGGNEYLLPIKIASRFTPSELLEMRKAAGYTPVKYEIGVTDHTLRDLDKILAYLTTLSAQERHQRALLLWDALADVESNRGKTYFSGKYVWHHYTERSYSFSAAFIEQLRSTPWVPKGDGSLGLPAETVFETLIPAWTAHPFLLAQIPFKPRAEVELARLAGIDPGILDLIKSLGITSREELTDLLKIASPEQPEKSSPAPDTVPLSSATAPDIESGDDSADASAELGTHGVNSTSNTGAGNRNANIPHSNGVHPRGSGISGGGTTGSHGRSGGESGSSHPHPAVYRPVFHTYVAVSPEDDPADPEGLEQSERMNIERKAIDYILSQEPNLKTTPQGNPGFDLYDGLDMRQATRLIEVKARSGPWTGPVALSAEQFRRAQAYGSQYWLYVVESTSEAESTRLHRIQDPVGKARYFSFDAGWSALTVDSLERALEL